MKKYFTILLFVVALFVLSDVSKVSAQSVSSIPTTINARILPTVWYSTLSADDGDSIKIYAGIQNNSDINFTGTAIFYVDSVEVSHSSFSSTVDSLKDISTNWVANPGAHTVQVKISTSLSSGKALVSSESEISSINIVPKITAQAVQTAALDTVSAVVSKVGDLANAFADKIDSFKKPVTSSGASSGHSNASGSKKGAVLGTSTVNKSSATNNNQTTDSVFNMCMSFLSFLFRNWMWTLFGIILLFLIMKIISWRKNK